MVRKKLWILLFCLVLLLTTCVDNSLQNSSKETTREGNQLVIWWNKGYYTAEDEAIQKVVRDWEQESGIKVKLCFFSDEDILQQAIIALEQGNLPDVFFSDRADGTVGPRWIWDGKLVNVSGIVEPIEELFDKAALRAVNRYSKISNEQSYYAVPLEANTIHIHYWRDLLAQAGFQEADIPRQWDTFWQFWRQAQDALRDQGVYSVYGLGLTMSREATDTSFQFEQILEAYDVQLVDQEGNLRLDNPQVRQQLIDTLEWFTSFYEGNYVPPTASEWLDADNNFNFLNRTTLMTLNNTLSIPASQREDEDIYFNQIATIEFPQEPDGEEISYLITINQAFIFADSPNQKAAKEFLSYLVQPEHLGDYIKGARGRWFPVMPKLRQDPFWRETKDPHIAIAVKQFTQSDMRPMYDALNPAYSQVLSENIWGQAIEKIILSSKSPEMAADEAIREIKDIFDTWGSQ